MLWRVLGEGGPHEEEDEDGEELLVSEVISGLQIVSLSVFLVFACTYIYFLVPQRCISYFYEFFTSSYISGKS